jgi:predicted lipid carrier protein YhbT
MMTNRAKNFSKPRFILPATVIAVLSAAALTSALAGTPAESVSKGAMLTPQQITEQLLAQGYAQVIRMEMEDGVYEVKVKTSEGKRESLNVDPTTGKVLGMHEDGFFSN